MKKIAIFSSGAGSNAENIYNFFANGNRVKVELVIYDRKDAPVAERMRARDVDTIYIPSEVWTDRPDEIVELLMRRGIDLVVLAGFLRMVPEQLTRAFAGRMLNIHPSLLPAYGGKGMYGRKVHEAVIAAGDIHSGATVHYVTTDLDRGEILMQEEVEVAPDDTPATLEEKVHKAEYSLYPRAIVAALGRLDNQAAKIAAGEAPAPTAEHSAEESPKSEPAAADEPGREWAEALGVNYDPTKLPPNYPGAVPPPIPGAGEPAAAPAANGAPMNAKEAYANMARNAYGNDVPPMPPAYLVWAVVMTVCCCLPAGVVAIIFSSQVSSKYYAGDIEGARRSSERAQIWIIVSFVLGVLSNTLYLPIAMLFN